MIKVKEEWAQFIMGRVLVGVTNTKTAKESIEKIKGTGIGIRPDLMKIFKKLVDRKLIYLEDKDK